MHWIPFTAFALSSAAFMAGPGLAALRWLFRPRINHRRK